MAKALCRDYDLIYLKVRVTMYRAVLMLTFGALKAFVDPTKAGMITGK